MKLEDLRRTGRSCLHTVAVERAAIDDLRHSLADSGIQVRAIRAAKARSRARLFDEMAAALQFPAYFGENWDALADCLADLDSIPGGPVVLLFTDAVELLADDRGSLGQLIGVLRNVAAAPSQAERRGDGASLHALFCSAPGDHATLVRALEAAGAHTDEISFPGSIALA